MTAGFPRPRKYVKKVRHRLAANESYFKQDWNNKEYPIPYTARMDDIGKIAVTRVNECKKYDLCIVCGVKVDNKYPWVYVWSNQLVSDSGPFHEKCVKLTQTMCPFVSENPDRYRFIQISWDALHSRDLPAQYKI